MQDSQILSAFQERPLRVLPREPARALVFDACHVGVILRAVLFVVAVVAVGETLIVLTRNIDRLGILALDNELFERRRPGDVRALADIDEAGCSLGHTLNAVCCYRLAGTAAVTSISTFMSGL